ncbi:YqgU-like beta propeller domain-containing protein [Rossellomorea aquimaris]|uniref:YqgU-like beta propeller domain-containing protein n=1 Tax=Rossellomorea aquimaris TaxID=189382 RepID=UPI0007D045D3|nr:hypothetical protein [Rossellomorea aquimaris]
MVKSIWKLFVLFFIGFILLSACQSKETTTSLPQKSEAPVIKEVKMEGQSSKGFIENIDWVSESEILTVKKEENQTALYIYDVFEGSSRKIYETSSYVLSAVSPDKEKIIIHSAPTTYSAELSIIDLNGTILFQDEIPSYELTYSWSKYDESRLLITSFAEDWSFQVFLLDLQSKTMDLLQIDQPFLHWRSDVEVLFQDWNEEDISVSAPLVSKNILDNEEQLVVESSIHFNVFNKQILAVVPTNEEDRFTYQFITQDGKVDSHFEVSLLSRYSDWLIPYYDMIEDKDQLLTFVANEPGVFDTYNGTFSLRSWNAKTGEETILYKELPLEPIKCSPTGTYCLYGNQLEKIIDLKNTTIIQLVKEEGANM